jgi:AraC-like DNA-binding protein
MDVLSESLSTVHMTSAIFFNAEFTEPWAVAEPHSREFARVLAPESERLIPYHLIMEGDAHIRVEGMPGLSLSAGDIVILPQGDPHTLSNGSASASIDGCAWLNDYVSADLSTARFGGGGATTRFVCGFFGCAREADRTFLAGLPPLIKVNVRGDGPGKWLESSIRHLVSETATGNAGGTALLAKMAEALFIETLRRYMRELPPDQIGWLAGAKDPVVGAVLNLLHRDPCRRWSVAELASEIGASRTVVAQRFTHFLGEPPISYLSRWRLQLATRLLGSGRKTVLQVASEVGYESEAAFNRAFKREFGLPPAQFRKKLAGDAKSSKPNNRRSG